eukprot:scaffold30632_cov112-Isochrysis_galbana.AAC.1
MQRCRRDGRGERAAASARPRAGEISHLNAATKLERSHRKCTAEHGKKVEVVARPDAVVDPRAVVVKHGHALVAPPAVLRPLSHRGLTQVAVVVGRPRRRHHVGGALGLPPGPRVQVNRVGRGRFEAKERGEHR